MPSGPNEEPGRIIQRTMRRLAPVPSLVIALVACTPEPEGPVAPIAVEQFADFPALDVSAARQAVVDFVSAYAASPTEGSIALANLVATDELHSWVRWLDVQNREFAGSIDATADIRDVEFIGSVRTRQATGAQVALSASVTFAYAPVDAEAFDLARILDGPVTLLRADDGVYKVVDLLRDGVSMSDGIQLFQDQTQTHGTVEVTLDSLFMFPPNWQFNVIVRNLGVDPITIDPGAVGLSVGGPDAFQRVDGVVTTSLTVIPPGTEAAGIMAYPLQDSASGTVLTVVYRTARKVLRFEFPLDHLFTAVPAPPPPAQEDVRGVTA